MKLVDGLSPAAQAAVIARHGAVEQSAVPALRIHVAQVPAAELAQALQAFAADPQVESVEAVKTRRAEWLSNDAYVGEQWSLTRIGWPTVYSTLTPTGTATVALLDTGVDGTHPDLQGNLSPGASFLDDGDGLTDPAGHGTQLAGLIAAVADNQQGIAGVAFSGVKVMPVRVLDAAGVGQDSAIIAGIVWAADHGADVILMGFGNPDLSQHLQDAIDYAWSKGVVLVAAAGNAGATTPSYPAANRAVIGIAASDPADRLAGFSNRGGAIFLAAPGTELATTDRAGGYATVSGTSPAAALVAGAAALLKAAEPTLTNGQVLGRLARGAAPVADPQEAPAAGFGRVDLAAALADTGTEELAPLESLAGVYGWPTPAALAAAEEAAALAAAGATDPVAGTAPFTTADTGAAAQTADYTAASSDPVLPGNPVVGFPVADGDVYAVAVDSATGITYIGGYFTSVGPYVGHGALIDAATGRVRATFPNVNGTINVIAADGSGGWYIGGAFSRVNNFVRNGLAHIKSDGTLDGAWNPNANGTVNALAVVGTTVYAGGDFTSIEISFIRTTRNRLAAITADRQLTTWDPNANGTVSALAVSGTTVYAGGDFTTIGGTPRNYLAAIGTDGTLDTAWNPIANAAVYDLELIGATVYAGGDFTTIGGTTRNYLAAIGTDGTLDTAWNPNADSYVHVLAVSGTNIYAGGGFNAIGGTTRNHLAAIGNNGVLTDWNPNADGWVSSLAVSGTTVYAGGDFTTIGGTARNRLAALATTSGAVTAWDPSANDSVHALAVSGTTVYAGGDFNILGGRSRYNLAAIAADGVLTDWNPNADGWVLSLAVSGTTVYAGGDFWNIGDTERRGLAAIGTDGTLAAWNPDVNNRVYALAVSESTLYAGGYFSQIGGTARNCLAAFDTTSGALTTWNPDANDTVRALTLDGPTLYAGGDFSQIGTTARSRLAAFDTTNGALTTWGPSADGIVNALAVSGTTVYAGGQFARINGTLQYRLAAIDTGGTLADWTPDANGFVSALAVSGTTVYAGGDFLRVGGADRNRLAALDAATGTATTWNPNVAGTVNALAVNGNALYAGGRFTAIGTIPRLNLAKFQPPVATTTAVAATPNPAVIYVAVTLTATLSSATATGSVTFKDGTTTLGTGTLTGGSATYVTNALALGSHSITAVYAGDADHLASTSDPYALTIISKRASSVVVTSSLNPSTYGQAVTFTATISPSGLTGRVDFDYDGNWGCSYVDLVNDQAACTLTEDLRVGTNSLKATYKGNAEYDSSSASVDQTVTKADQTISFANPGTKTYGTSPTLTATATSTLAVSFSSTTPTVCTITSGGVLTFLNVGPCTIAADQAGNTRYNAAPRVTQTFAVVKADSSVSAWPTAGTIYYGQTLGDSTLSGGSATPAGGFAFTAPDTAPGGGTADQAVTFTPGDSAHYNTAAGAVSVTVTRATTSAALTAAPNPSTLGQSVQLTATVTPAGGSGTVTFMADGAILGNESLGGGTASLSTAALTAGSHSLTAVYAGDANYQGATSPAVTQVVTQVVQVPVTVGTNVPGLSVTVDGNTQVAPYTGAWTPGSSHTIAVTTVQGESAGARWAFSAWSDGGALSHTVIAPASAATYTANYAAQYQIATAANPAGTASVSWSLNGQSQPGNWFAAGTAVAVQAFPTAPNAFSAWSGDVTGSANPVTVTVNGPLGLTANTTVPPTSAVLTPGPGLGRSGANPADRTWSFTLANNSAVAAGTVRVTGVTLTPSAACTPKLLTALPVDLGSIAANGGTAVADLHIDFGNCPSSTLFKATFTYTFAGAGGAPTKSYKNQSR